MKEVRVLARKQSMDALIALIGCYKRPDGKIDRAVDGRVVVAAASTVLKWAYGEPPPYDPNAEKSDVRINLEGMSLAERRRILEIMDRVETVAADSDSGDDDGPSFDASRFAPEPVTIEADVVVPPAPAQRSPKAIAPKAAKQPQQPQRLKLPSDSIP
jgi:hypothetical protein